MDQHDINIIWSRRKALAIVLEQIGFDMDLTWTLVWWQGGFSVRVYLNDLNGKVGATYYHQGSLSKPDRSIEYRPIANRFFVNQQLTDCQRNQFSALCGKICELSPRLYFNSYAVQRHDCLPDLVHLAAYLEVLGDAL